MKDSSVGIKQELNQRNTIRKFEKYTSAKGKKYCTGGQRRWYQAGAPGG